MDAKAMFKVKYPELVEQGHGKGVEPNWGGECAAIIFAACIIAATVGNGLEALTKAINDNTEEYKR